MNKSRLGKLGTLGQFSGIKQTSAQGQMTETTRRSQGGEDTSPHATSSTEMVTQEDKEVGSKKTVTKKTKKSSSKDKLVNINIKVNKSQKDWLTDKAFEVRENNDEPVPPNERVYPQHLVGVAISLLQSQDIDWSQIKNEQQLRKQLNL